MVRNLRRKRKGDAEEGKRKGERVTRNGKYSAMKLKE